MTQDNPNDTSRVEEPEASTQVPDGVVQQDHSTAQTVNALGAEPIIGDSVEDTNVPAKDNADDELQSDDDSGESEDTEDGADAAEPASNPNDSVATQSSGDATAKSGQDEDERCVIEKQPYDFDHCTVQVAIQLLPNDGDPNGRMVVVGVRSHLDTPILRLVRLNELGTLPPIVITLLDELKAELPAREQTAREAFEKKKEEKDKRKANLAASRVRASQRGKKAAKVTTLSTAPTEKTPTADNRSLPEVTVPKNPQQQMGLF